MRVSRSSKHKRLSKCKKQLIISMTGLLSVASMSGAQIATPTFGLVNDSIHLEGDQTVQSFFVFPSTILAKVDIAFHAYSQISTIEIAQIDTELIVINANDETVVDETLNSDDMDEMLDSNETLNDDEMLDEEESEIVILTEQLLQIGGALDLLRSQIGLLQISSENAENQHQIIYTVLMELLAYDQEVTDSTMRAKLYLDFALSQVQQYEATASSIVNGLYIQINSLLAMIDHLEKQYSGLQVAIELAEQRILDKSNSAEQEKTEEVDGESKDDSEEIDSEEEDSEEEDSEEEDSEEEDSEEDDSEEIDSEEEDSETVDSEEADSEEADSEATESIDTEANDEDSDTIGPAESDTNQSGSSDSELNQLDNESTGSNSIDTDDIGSNIDDPFFNHDEQDNEQSDVDATSTLSQK